MRLVFANEATAARRRVYFHIVDATDGITAETGEAAGQPQVSSDGAAFTNTGIGTLTHLGNGRYYADLTQTLVATAGVSIETRYKSAATAETPGDSVQVVAFDPYSTSMGLLLAAANLSSDTITAAKIATGAITAAKFAAGAIDAAAIATDAITAAKIAADAIGASELAADAVTEIQSGLATSAALATAQADLDDIQLRLPAALTTGTADSGTTSTMVDAARTEADTDYWKGSWIRFTSGTISGQTRLITGFNAATDTITFAPVTTQAVGTNTYEIIPAGGVDVHLWKALLPNDLVSGRMSSHVVGFATGTITAAAFAAGAIDAAAIATDAIGSAELAASAVDKIADQVWDELIAGHLGAGSTGAALNGASAPTAAAVADAVWDEARAGHVAGGSFGEGVASVQGNVTGSVGSVTGNVGGNVTGSVGSVAAGGIAAASFAAGAIDNAAIAADAIGSSELAASAVNEIADQVWEEAIADHSGTAGSTAEALDAAASGGSAPSAAVIADAVWDELRSGHVGAGSFGQYVLADAILISGDSAAADSLETMLDGTGGNVLTLAQLRINSAAAGGGIDIDNSAGPAISARTSSGTSVEAVSTGGNGSGLVATGQGTGRGIIATGGATGNGITALGGATSGHGIRGEAQASGSGMSLLGAGTGGSGCEMVGAAAGGSGLRALATTGNSGIRAEGGSSGHGIEALGGGTSGDGIRAEAANDGTGLNARGFGTGSGIRAEGGATGHGVDAIGGATSGDGIHAEADTLGDGIEAVGAGGGFDINADIQGNLSGSVASVTGNVGGNVVGSVGSVATGGIAAASFAAGAIDAAAIAADAIGSSELAASAVNEIADQVWDEVLSGHLTAGTTGAALNAAGSGASAATIADAVWDELLADHVTANTMGANQNLIDNINSDTDDIQTRLPAALVSGRMDSSVGAMAAGVVTAAAIATDAIDADAMADGAITAATFAAGAIDATAIAADAIGSSELAASAVTEIQAGLATAAALATVQADTDDIQTRLPAALVGGRMDSSIGAVAANAITAAGLASDVTTELRSLVSGTSDSGSTTTMVDAARTEADADYWKGAWILFTSGNISGQARLITAFDAATDTITFTPATTQAVATQTYEILPAAAVDVRLWNGSAPNNLVSGRVDSSVGAMAADVVTAAAIAADAIGSSELAASAVNEIADQVWDELIAGHAVSGSTGEALAAAAAGGSPAAIADAVWDEARAGHVAAGSFGEGVASVQGNVTGSVASVTGNVGGNVVGSVASVTGNVGGNVTGSVGSVAAGGITAASIATGAIDADALATDAVNEIVDQVWDEALAGHLAAGSTGEALDAAAAGGAGLTQQQVRDAMKLAPTAGAPAAGSVDLHLDDIEADTQDIQSRLPAALVSGRMDSSVGAMAAGVVTAAAVATDAIDSDAIAASAVTEIQAGLATSAALAVVQADTDDIQARLPATLVGGRMRSHTEAMDAGVITATVIATDAIDADALAASALAEINTEVDTALVDIRLDELIQNAAAPVTPTINSFWDRVTSKDGSQTYDRSTDSLEAVRDALAAAGPSAAVIADAVWDEALADHVAVGSMGFNENLIDDVFADTNDIQTRLPAALVGGRMDSSVGAMAAGTVTAAAIATGAIDADALATDAVNEIVDQVWDELIAGHLGAGSTGEALNTAGSGASAAAIADAVWDEALAGHVIAGSTGEAQNMIDDILTDTAAIQPLVDVAVSTRATPAQVNTEVDTALADIRLDELIQNVAAPITPTIDSFMDRITSKNGAQTYDRSTDSLEAASDAIVAAGPSAAVIADAVWDEALAGHLIAGSTGAALDAIGDDLDTVMGPGFNPLTDSLEEIRDEVDACCGVGGGNGADVINIEGI